MTKNPLTKSFAIATIALAITAFFGCSNKPIKSNRWIPPTGQFAFAEYYVTYSGTAIDGDPPPGMRIDSPTYSFDSENKSIDTYLGASFINDSVNLVLGTGVIRRGTEGSGVSSRLVGIKQLPFEQNQLTIETVNEKQIKLRFKDEEIKVKSGNFWEFQTESIDTIPSINGKAVIQRKINHRFTYHGLISNEKLKIP
jgi:hypothetical protein